MNKKNANKKAELKETIATLIISLLIGFLAFLIIKGILQKMVPK